MKLPISAFILTYNEERNLYECLSSINDHVDEIIIVDSFSNDKTLTIAEKFNTRIYQNKYINHSAQIKWTLDNVNFSNNWLMKLDADERWTKDGFKELNSLINDEINEYQGIHIKRKVYFMNKWIRFGGYYPNYFLFVFNKDIAKVENKWMDEHIYVSGKTYFSNVDVLEKNYDRQQNISLWTDKHNVYSTREAIDYLIKKYNSKKFDSFGNPMGNKTERKTWIKENMYYKLPKYIRPLIYFLYRYIFLLGFLDGGKGLIYHFLQAFWYRFLVDIKISQIESMMNKEDKDLSEVVLDHFNIRL